MRKAVVVGGSNGIGLAIANKLISGGYKVTVVDVVEPDYANISDTSAVDYVYCNLLDFNDEIFKSLANDADIDTLMVTAGFGRVAEFEYLSTVEIQKLLRVNTEAGLKIISLFYDKIKGDKPFYTGMMGSIAGLISSPMFSVYAASKAAICRFIESVNIELEKKGTANRILNVSPGSMKGTRFNGGTNNLELSSGLASDIVDKLFERAELYIPDYDKTYERVLAEYHDDAHQFGLDSYTYKKNSGRLMNEKRLKIGYLSGTFDLFHIGHLNLLRNAKQKCDYLVVGVHSDGSWKGKETFISLEERMEIVGACKYVDKVIEAPDNDDDAWDICHYNALFVGSDYKGTERFNKYEKELGKKGVEITYFPYTKTTSSTQLRCAIKKHNS